MNCKASLRRANFLDASVGPMLPLKYLFGRIEGTTSEEPASQNGKVL